MFMVKYNQKYKYVRIKRYNNKQVSSCSTIKMFKIKLKNINSYLTLNTS